MGYYYDAAELYAELRRAFVRGRSKHHRPAARGVWEKLGHFWPGDVVAVPPYGFSEEVLGAAGVFVGTLDTDKYHQVRIAAHLRHCAGCGPCRTDFDRHNRDAEQKSKGEARRSPACTQQSDRL